MSIECRGNPIKVWGNDNLLHFGTKCTAAKNAVALQGEGADLEFWKFVLTSFVAD